MWKHVILVSKKEMGVALLTNVFSSFGLIDGCSHIRHQDLGLDQVLLVMVVFLSALKNKCF